MTTYVHDMTKGNETAHLVRFAIPMLIGNLFQQVHNIVDSIVVGKYLGDTALAGVGIVASLNFLFFSICIGLSVGIGVVIAHYFGAGKEGNVKKTIGNAVYVIAAVGVIMTVIGVVFARPILTLLNTPSDVIAYAVEYMQILTLGIIFVAGYNGISAILRALGDAKTPLIFLIVSSLINAGLDILFVVKFEMGMGGAALATVIAQAVAMIGSILFAVKVNPYLRLRREDFLPDKKVIKKSLKIGLPMSAQFSLIALSLILLQKIVNGYGSVTVAAFTATARIEQIIYQPFNSLGAAVSTFTGQNMGQGNVKRVRTGFKKSVMMVIAFAVFTCMIFFVAGEATISFFVSNPEAIAMGAMGLRITSIFYIMLGMIYITRGLLNGAGDTTFAFINGMMEVIGRVGFSLIFVRIPSLGVWALWITTGMTWALAGAAGIWRYLQGKWTKIKV